MEWKHTQHLVFYANRIGAFVFPTTELMNSFLFLPVITHGTFNLLTSEQHIMYSLKYFLSSRWIDSAVMKTLMLRSLTCRCLMDAQSWLNVWACILTGGITIIIRGCNTQSNLCSLESYQWQNVNLIRAAGRSWPWLNYNVLTHCPLIGWNCTYLMCFCFKDKFAWIVLKSLVADDLRIILAKFMFLSIWQ